MDVTVGLAFLAGLASFLSPCVFPLVPAYIGYMGGRVTNAVSAQIGGGAVMQRPSLAARLSTLSHGFAFVAGFTAVFVIIGLAATAFVQEIGNQNVVLVRDIIGRVGGVVIIFFGLHLMGVIPRVLRALLGDERLIGSAAFSLVFLLVVGALIVWAFIDILIGLPVLGVFGMAMFVGGAFTQPADFWRRTIARFQSIFYADTRRQMIANGGGGYGSSALMGVVFAAGWTPCIGPIYGTILNMAWQGENLGSATAMLFAYSFGLGVPFLLSALLLDGTQGLLRRLGRHLHRIEFVTGVFLVVIGVLVASGELQRLSSVAAIEFGEFSYQLEHCLAETAQGNLSIGQLGECINQPLGTTPVATGS